MHETYLAFATQIACDRMREAAAWRLADEARRNERAAGQASRLGRLIAAIGRQSLTAAVRSESSDCR
jgi:hypothetical protein